MKPQLISILAASAMTLSSVSVAFPQKPDDWKNIGTASAAAAILGILTKNGTVTTLGTAGTLYSLYRYSEDIKSTDKNRRKRAQAFSHKSFVHKGVRYDRKVVTKKGVKYYRFERHH